MDGDRGDLAKFRKKTQQGLIFLPHYMWAENNNPIKVEFDLHPARAAVFKLLSLFHNGASLLHLGHYCIDNSAIQAFPLGLFDKMVHDDKAILLS